MYFVEHGIGKMDHKMNKLELVGKIQKQDY